MLRPRRLLVGVIVVAFVGTACGESDDSGVTSTAPPATQAPTTTTTTTAAPPTTATPTTTSATTAATTTSTTTTAAPVPEGPLAFDFGIVRGVDNPVIKKKTGDEWDSSWTFSPNVVYHDGVFHMFYTGWGNNAIGIGYASSTNGVDFTEHPDNPILDLAPGDNQIEAGRAVARVLDDGTWEMFVGEWVNLRTQGNGIWRATAPEPTGPWTIDSDPLFQSPTGSWGSRIEPQSVATGSDIVYYDGRRLNAFRIGALLPDGSGGWIPFNDPATDSSEFEVHDPIYFPTGNDDDFDRASVASPLVLEKDDGTYEMFYAGWWQDRTTSRDQWDWLGYATSDDGLSWERYEYGPVIELTNENGWLWMSMIEVDDVYYLYYAIKAGADGIGLIQGTITER